MNELRSGNAERLRFRARIFVAALVVLLGFGLVAARLVVLQVSRHEALTEQAESNRTAVVPIVPNRGLILDRNGIPLAVNYKAYTLELTPGKLRGAPSSRPRSTRCPPWSRSTNATAAASSGCWKIPKGLNRCRSRPG